MKTELAVARVSSSATHFFRQPHTSKKAANQPHSRQRQTAPDSSPEVKSINSSYPIPRCCRNPSPSCSLAPTITSPVTSTLSLRPRVYVRPRQRERKWLCPPGDSSIDFPPTPRLVIHGPSTQNGIFLAEPNRPAHLHRPQPFPASLPPRSPECERGCQSQYQ